MATRLLFDIAWTHVTARVRQTLVGMAGVAMGVGFTIMMAGLMQGSQIDFLRQLVDTMPHITIQDERRSLPTQPADREYGAVQMSNVTNREQPPRHQISGNDDGIAALLASRRRRTVRCGPPRSSITAAAASA